MPPWEAANPILASELDRRMDGDCDADRGEVARPLVQSHRCAATDELLERVDGLANSVPPLSEASVEGGGEPPDQNQTLPVRRGGKKRFVEVDRSHHGRARRDGGLCRA